MNHRRKVVVALLTLQVLWVPGISCAQARVPLVAALIHGTEDAFRTRLDAFRDGMRELGYVEGKNFHMETRFSDVQMDRLPGLARELLQMKPDVVIASPVLSAQAFNRESKTVPIVMAGGVGALRLGLIDSMARPGGNVTGVSNQSDELTQRQFQILKDIAPRVKRVMVLSSGKGASEPDSRREARNSANAYGMKLVEVLADSPELMRQASVLCERERCDALVLLIDPYFANHRQDAVALAATLRIPASYPDAGFAEAGGLIAYGANFDALSRRAATYVDKILKGAKAGDLPVEQPTKFELVINRKTAKTLGLKIPQSLLISADKIID